MLANLLIRPGVLQLKEVKTPEPSYGEILVRIKASLTCGTDLKAFKRGHPLIPMPSVFGHEFSGVIEKTGRGVRGFSRGMEVMAVHTAPCGSCCFCRKKMFNLCDSIMDSKVLGAFAEYILLPKHVVEHNVFKKAEKLADDEDVLHRVQVARLPIQYVQISTLPETDPKRAAIIDRFFRVVDKAGITNISEGRSMAQYKENIGVRK